MNGNIDRPTVEMMPKIESSREEQGHDSSFARMARKAAAAPRKPRTGAIIIQGWVP